MLHLHCSCAQKLVVHRFFCTLFNHLPLSSPFLTQIPVPAVHLDAPYPHDHSATENELNVKFIVATIKPFLLEDVREALVGIGIRGIMVTEIKGFGAQSGHTEIYRGAEYTVNYVPKMKLEIAAPDDMVDQIVSTITTSARTGKIGDGKVFVMDLQQAVRVRTGETGDDAL